MLSPGTGPTGPTYARSALFRLRKFGSVPGTAIYGQLVSEPGDSAADIASWDSVAAVYSERVTGSDSISARFGPFLDQELGPLAGKAVLDLGCGHGWLAARLAAAGAEAVGLDGSAELLAIARTRHPGVELLQADLTLGLGSAQGRTFDRIVSLMVLMDLPALDPLLGDVSAALRPGGRFIFTMPHPCFWAQIPVEDQGSGERFRKVRSYLPLEHRWVTSFGGHRHYHRPLSWYFDRLAEAGLGVARLVEPPTPPTDNRPAEEWTDYEVWMSTIPTMIGVSAGRLDPEA
jgi:SAM-dependent methyltransferase